MKRSVTVDVAGQKLTLRTEIGDGAEEEYIASLAELVNRKIGEVKASSRTVSTHLLVVMAALRIADDLIQAQKKEAELRKKVREKSQRILELLEASAADN